MKGLTEEQKKKVEDLLAQMTLEEKIGQMNQESPSIVGGFDVPFSELIEMMTDGRISKEEFGKIMATSTQDFHEDIEKGTTSYRNVLNAIKDKEKQLKKEDKDAKIDDIIAKMEKNVVIFEDNYKQYDLFFKALLDEKDDTINEISDESIKKLAKSYYDHYVSYQKTRKEFRSAGCRDTDANLSASEQQICDAYEDQLDEDETAMKNSTLMKKLFIGDDEGTISDNYVKDSITEIYLKIRNSGVKNEDENKENS